MTDISIPPALAAGSKPVRRRKPAAVVPPFAAPASDEAADALDATASFAEAIAASAEPCTLPVTVPVVTAPVVVDVPTRSTPIDKGPDMATNAADATFQTADKAQSMMSDVQSRARDTMEKSSKMYEEMGSFAKGNVEALMASSRVAASGFEALGQDMAALGKRSFEQATTAFKSFAAVKSPTELFQLQSDYARTAFDGLVAEGSKMSEKVLKLAGDVAQPLSSRFAVAAEKIKIGM